MEKPIFAIVLALLLPSMLLSAQIVQSVGVYGSLIPTTCVSHAGLSGNLGEQFLPVGKGTEMKARRVIIYSRGQSGKNSYYHWVSEFNSGAKQLDNWDKKKQFYKTWLDDVFLMHYGFYDYQFLRLALNTLAEATRKIRFLSCTPVYFDIRSLYGCTDWVDNRSYGALYFNIMVFDYVRVTKDFSSANGWKDVVLRNHRFIHDNYMAEGVYYDTREVPLQPDYVLKSGYIADMTIYYLISLKALEYLYGISISDEFAYVTRQLISKLWQNDKGFFIDWIDPEGRQHVHYGTEQLWGVIYDVLPNDVQQAMFQALRKEKERCGRFWQYQMYDENEKTSDGDYAYKLGQVMLYLQTLRKFGFNSSFIQEQIDRYDQCIVKYGFCDHYVEKDDELVNIGTCNYIMNAGPWIAILRNNDLST